MIAIIDYGSGNLGSVRNALMVLGKESVVTADPETILRAEGVIFPGQGRAGPTMANLRSVGLDKLLPTISVPFLGICLGMQLLCDVSEEDDAVCLGIIPGQVRKFPMGIKAPHMGWNTVMQEDPCPLWKGIPDGSHFYFVHSYFVDTDPALTLGTTSYETRFISAIEKENFIGVQFHPEKSGEVGLRLLRNFLELC